MVCSMERARFAVYRDSHRFPIWPEDVAPPPLRWQEGQGCATSGRPLLYLPLWATARMRPTRSFSCHRVCVMTTHRGEAIKAVVNQSHTPSRDDLRLAALRSLNGSSITPKRAPMPVDTHFFHAFAALNRPPFSSAPPVAAELSGVKGDTGEVTLERPPERNLIADGAGMATGKVNRVGSQRWPHCLGLPHAPLKPCLHAFTLRWRGGMVIISSHCRPVIQLPEHQFNVGGKV